MRITKTLTFGRPAIYAATAITLALIATGAAIAIKRK